MKTNSFRNFVFEGIQQAGFVLGALALLAGIGWLSGFQQNEPIAVLGNAVLAIAALAAVGPVPLFLTVFDISMKELLVWSCVLIVPYWICLGTFAGFLRWYLDDPNSQPVIVGFRRWLKGDARTTAEVQPGSFWKRTRPTRVIIEGLAVLLGFMLYCSIPMSGNGRFSFRSQIVSHLLAIRTAKAMFFQDNKLPSDYIPTPTDLAPFGLNVTNFFHEPKGPFHYVLNASNQPPYAIMDADLRFPRRGWREGFTITNGTVFRIP